MDGHLSQDLNEKIHRRCRNASQSSCLKINSTNKIQLRIMSVTFNCNFCTTIVSCNRPANASDEMDTTNFYSELSFLIRLIPKHNVPVLGENMNVPISKDRNNKFC